MSPAEKFRKENMKIYQNEFINMSYAVNIELDCYLKRNEVKSRDLLRRFLNLRLRSVRNDDA